MALLIPAAALNSCNDDDEAVGGSYLRIENPMVGSNTKEVTRVPSYSELDVRSPRSSHRRNSPTLPTRCKLTPYRSSATTSARTATGR